MIPWKPHMVASIIERDFSIDTRNHNPEIDSKWDYDMQGIPLAIM